MRALAGAIRADMALDDFALASVGGDSTVIPPSAQRDARSSDNWNMRVLALLASVFLSCTTGAGCVTANTGEAELRGIGVPIRVWTDCTRLFGVVHRIVTHDTPRARDLHGKLVIRATGGDPAVVRLHRIRVRFFWVPFFFARPYRLGTPIPVVEPGHVGGGVHTWHEGTELFSVTGIKAGFVDLEASVDPDPEVPEGDGIPTVRARFRVEVPLPTSIAIADASWNDLDEKTVVERAGPLRAKVHVNLALASPEEVPCHIKVRMSGSRVAAEGTNAAGAIVRLTSANASLAPGGQAVRVELTMADLIRDGAIPSAPRDGVTEYTTLDYVSARPVGSNQNDSEMFEAQSSLALRHIQRGKARTTENGTDGDMTATPPEASANASFMKAGGAELVEVERDGVVSPKRWFQNQADALYHSGHGDHASGTLGLAGGARFSPADAQANWNHEIEKVFIAGCSVLDIKNYNNNPFSSGTANASPGELWLNAGPRLLFGYCWKAPLDDSAGNSNHTADIVRRYFANRAAGMNENWSWGSANETVAAGNRHDTAEGRGMNCCMIDLTGAAPTYWYFAITWGGFLNLSPSYSWTSKTPPW